MAPDALPSSPVRVAFSANGRPFRIEVRVPDGRARLDQLLPALREIDDQLMDATVARHEAAGERISCQKGCSACCRVQPVPVTPPEAFALARLVDALPEPRRTAVRAAFTAAVERLREAGLYAVYMQRDPKMTRAAAWRRFAATGRWRWPVRFWSTTRAASMRSVPSSAGNIW